MQGSPSSSQKTSAGSSLSSRARVARIFPSRACRAKNSAVTHLNVPHFASFSFAISLTFADGWPTAAVAAGLRFDRIITSFDAQAGDALQGDGRRAPVRGQQKCSPREVTCLIKQVSV